MPTSNTAHNSIRTKFSKLDLENVFAIVSMARKGVKPKIFYDFANAINTSEKVLASMLNLSARTISNYHDLNKTLESIQSEHLLKLIALYAKGEQLFGTIDEFNYWLQKPFTASEERPVDWLVTPGGVDLIMAELDRLAHGYAV